MNNKAFTLAELLVIIVILSVLAIITVPTIIDVINSSKKQTLDEQKRIIIDAANRWGTDNTKKLPTTSCDLTIDFLKKEILFFSSNQLSSANLLSIDSQLKLNKLKLLKSSFEVIVLLKSIIPPLTRAT